MDVCRTEVLFDLSHTLAAPLFEGKERPWEVLDELKEFIEKLGRSLPSEEYDQPVPGVWVAKSAQVAPSAMLTGPCIIGPEAEVRHCAFIRGSALVGAGAVVGNSVELKNCILFDGAQVPHFNYVGDSILGYKAHMGAGAVTSNLKSDKSLVCIRQEEEILVTGRKNWVRWWATKPRWAATACCAPARCWAAAARFTPPAACGAWWLRVISTRMRSILYPELKKNRGVFEYGQTVWNRRRARHCRRGYDL